MRLPIYQVDAFADAPFKGNPAAIVPLGAWLPEAQMQAVAAENNLAETAFFVPLDVSGGQSGRFGLRWFTPKVEVDLCGHATLATAWVILNRLQPDLREIRFETKSGELIVVPDGESGRLCMDFPARAAEPTRLPEALAAALGAKPRAVYGQRDFLVVFETASEVRALDPDMTELMKLDRFAVIATAPGDQPGIDCVSRFFAPRAGIPEDPVTGSAHCTIVPYWAKRLGKDEITAYQASARGGTLYCRLAGDRVKMAGSCTPYLEGVIDI